MRIVARIASGGLWSMCALVVGCAPSGSGGSGQMGFWDVGASDGAASNSADGGGGDGGGADTAASDTTPTDTTPTDTTPTDTTPTDTTPTDTADKDTLVLDTVQPDTQTDSVQADTVQPDTQPDTVTPDVKPDTVTDVQQDTASDVKPDAVTDVQPDSTADVKPDADATPDVVKDSADVPTVNTCGAGKDIKSLLACTEGVVDFSLEKQVVTHVFGMGFLLYDASISRGTMVYLNPNTVTKPKLGDLVNLHVTKYATYNGQQEITGVDVLTIVGTGDAAGANLNLNVISKDMIGEAYESRVVTGTGLVVKQLSGSDGVLVAAGAGEQILRIDGPSNLCAGATFDLKSGAITQFGTSHRIQLLNGALDLTNVNIATCGAAPVYDQSNWGFEEVSDADPPPDFTKVGAALSATRTTQSKKNGLAACKLTWTSADNQDFVAGHFVAVQPGQKVTVSAWILDNDPAGRGRMSMTFYKADQTTIVSSQFSTTYTADLADWAQVGFSYTAPAEAAFVRGFVRLYDVSPAFTGTATIFVDDWTTAIQ